MEPIMNVLFYTKPGCHLCEDVEILLHNLQDVAPFTLEKRNILSNDAWFDRYWNKIPVVVIEDGPTLYSPIRPVELRAAILAAKNQTAPNIP
ncbi:MAG: glutaredoxin family protein [Caldilineae bacterium]|nr:MAG: glutaredoxin family protein [Caldilineae bacterium]